MPWLWLSGIPICFILGFITVRLIAIVWDACGNPAEGPISSLIFVWPAVAFLAWVAFSIGILVMRKRRALVRMTVAALLALVVCAVAFAAEGYGPLGQCAT